MTCQNGKVCNQNIMRKSGWGGIRTLDHLCVRPGKTHTYDKYEFISWLQSTKKQEPKTATGVASAIGTFVKSGKTPEDFVKSYNKPNSTTTC